ncbi:MAG: 5'-3' exonuclease H3TH domain-containing protein, partial [Campylobacterales bacterium]
MKELVIFDTYAFFFRNFYALPPLKNKDGFPTGLLTGFVNFLHSLRTEYHEENFLFALEGKGEGFRKELYSKYKANRPPAPQELKLQLPVAIEWIKQMGFCHLSRDGYEADDIIATTALKAKKEGYRVKIVSSDKDLYQLIDDDRIVLFDPIKKIDINSEACFKKFGVKPCDFVEFQSILGDTSDNIPGVKGIGQKGASKLIEEYHTLENIYENIENITPKRTQNLLLESKDQAFLSRELVRLKTDLDIELQIDSTKTGEINPLVKITDELIKYDMKQALDRVKKDSVIEVVEDKKADIRFSVETITT